MNWSIKLLILEATLCVIVVVLASFWNRFEYLDGWYLTAYSSGLLIMLALLMISVTVLILLNLIWLSKGFSLSRIMNVCLLAVVAFSGIFFWFRNKKQPGYISYMCGFTTRMKHKINIEDLRSWAVGLLNRDNSNYRILSQSSWPSFVRQLQCSQVLISNRVNSGARFVQLEFGGGFAHYGLIVGSQTLTMSSDRNLYVEVWHPGVYFYHTR